jgi:hypothetical protein
MTNMTINSLAATDAAYIAGLIDGEGTVTLTRKHKNENRQLAVTISNTERSLLEFCLQTIGAGKITNKLTTREHHTPSFTYAIYNRQALALLEQIHSYLRGYKAKRSQVILNHYLELTPRNGKYSQALLHKRTEFEATIMNIKASG